MKSMWWRGASMIWAMSLCAGQLTAQSEPSDELDKRLPGDFDRVAVLLDQKAASS